MSNREKEIAFHTEIKRTIKCDVLKKNGGRVSESEYLAMLIVGNS